MKLDFDLITKTAHKAKALGVRYKEITRYELNENSSINGVVSIAVCDFDTLVEILSTRNVRVVQSVNGDIISSAADEYYGSKQYMLYWDSVSSYRKLAVYVIDSVGIKFMTAFEITGINWTDWTTPEVEPIYIFREASKDRDIEFGNVISIINEGKYSYLMCEAFKGNIYTVENPRVLNGEKVMSVCKEYDGCLLPVLTQEHSGILTLATLTCRNIGIGRKANFNWRHSL